MENTPLKHAILLAEDSAMVRDGIISLLRFLPFVGHITAVETGDEAMIWAKNTKQGIALMDARLPGKLDGIDAGQLILKQYPLHKVIFITSYEEADLILTLLKTGAHGLLLKRLAGKAELEKAIATVASGEKYFTENVQILLTKRISQIDSLRPVKLLVRELNLLQHLTQGLTTKQIAEVLCLSEYTIESQRKELLSKVRVQNTVELVNFAHSCGLL
jgi:DNA-binding NarL/FixJ family response regulator